MKLGASFLKTKEKINKPLAELIKNKESKSIKLEIKDKFTANTTKTTKGSQREITTNKYTPIKQTT